MDEKVVQVIADELGMAVESAAQFLTDILPQYGAMKAVGLAVPSVLFVLTLIVGLVVGRYLIINREKVFTDTGYGGTHYDSEMFFFFILFWLAGLLANVLVLLFVLPNLLSWCFFPEAKFFGMVLGKVA